MDAKPLFVYVHATNILQTARIIILMFGICGME